LFLGEARLEIVQNQLFALAKHYEWQLQAWAIFPNHYHFVARAENSPSTLETWLKHLHSNAARDLNRLDGVSGRKGFYQFWDTRLTFQRSFLARLKYVHLNPVKHRLVTDARDYPFCSAAWFERTAPIAFQQTVDALDISQVSVPDDF